MGVSGLTGESRGPRGGAPAPLLAAYSTLSCRLREVERAIPVSVPVEVERAACLLQPSELRAVRIDEVFEVGDDVAASGVLQALHVIDDRGALLIVDCRERLLVESEELRVLRRREPVRLVERGSLQGAGGHLRQVVACPPVIGCE